MVFAGVAYCTILAGCRPSPQRPNIVLFIVDTLRADKLGAYGHPEPTSPQLDALAERGVRFARVIAQSSWTRPSIGSMLTSRHPHSIGIYKERQQVLDARFDTLAEILEENGYTTVGATANPNINSAFGFGQGFDHYLDSNVLWSWMTLRADDLSSDDHPLPQSAAMLDRVFEWIASRDSPPYYVQLNLMEVHEAAKEEVRERFDPDLFVEDPDAHYLQAVRYVAGQIDTFVSRLTELPEWDNTLFVITSDHGEGLKDHPDVPHSRGHGITLYESNLHVPLIIHDASMRIPGGIVVDRPVRLLDLVPTLLELVDIEVHNGLEGVSLAPLIRGTKELESPPDHFVVETEFMRAHKIGVYSREWIYIENRDRHPGTNPVALHRIGLPQNGSKTDLATEYPRVTLELRYLLQEWERRNPKTEPVLEDNELSSTELEQLRALGYLQQPGDGP